MRIFLGTHEIAGQLSTWARGFRALGHEVTTAVVEGDTYYFAPDVTYDTYIRYGDMNQFTDIVMNHDVFFFQWGASLLPNNIDYPIFRKAGKKLGCIFNGSDVRYWPAFVQTHGVNAADYYDGTPPHNMCDYFLPIVLGKLRRAELYADVIFSVPDTMSMALRPYQNFYATINCDMYTPHIPNRDVPIIVHAPSSRAFKGTELICQALSELQDEGMSFELRLLHDVPNSEVLKELQQADCIIDQQVGLGLFAREGMASGCAVASGYCEADSMNQYIPYFKLQKGMFKEGLREFIANRELRLKLAKDGLEHVRTYYDATKFCKKMLDDVMCDKQELVYDYYPRYFATKFTTSESVIMPCDCADIQGAIVRDWGIPHDADPWEMCKKGLLAPDLLDYPIPLWKDNIYDLTHFSGKKSQKGLPIESCFHKTSPASIKKVFDSTKKYKALFSYINIQQKIDDDDCVQEIFKQSVQQSFELQIQLISFAKYMTGTNMLNKGNKNGAKLVLSAFEEYTKTEEEFIALCSLHAQCSKENMHDMQVNINGVLMRYDYMLPAFLNFSSNLMRWASVFYMLTKSGYAVYINSDNIPYAHIYNKIAMIHDGM